MYRNSCLDLLVSIQKGENKFKNQSKKLFQKKDDSGTHIREKAFNNDFN